MSTSVQLVCPSDAALLERRVDRSEYACSLCDRRYPIENGVVRFLDSVDDFYEGRYLYTIRFVPRRDEGIFAWPLWLINAGYVWAVRKHVPAGGTLLEVGCASGVAYFANRYRVLGLDLSASSLARVAGLYDTCIQADATFSIPLPDSSVDGIASSFVWEHISPERKPHMLEECARVLKPGGRIVFLFDVECDNLLYSHLKRRDPDLYREILIDREGHLGWQSPEENRRLFEESGFRVLEFRGKDKLLIGPAMYDKVKNWDGPVRQLAMVGYRFAESRVLFHAYNAVERVLDETAGRLLPLSWSRVVVAVCARR